MIPHVMTWMKRWSQTSNKINIKTVEEMNPVKAIMTILISSHNNITPMTSYKNMIWILSSNHLKKITVHQFSVWTKQPCNRVQIIRWSGYFKNIVIRIVPLFCINIISGVKFLFQSLHQNNHIISNQGPDSDHAIPYYVIHISMKVGMTLFGNKGVNVFSKELKKMYLCNKFEPLEPCILST